jgi:hypothetical protein
MALATESLSTESLAKGSLSPIIDERYRLKPTDIGYATLRVTIKNVSLQGVEHLSPVLHLGEFPNKRLVIDSTQCQVLIRLTGSPLFVDWIGQEIDLKTNMHEGQTDITISAPQTENNLHHPTRWPKRTTARHQLGPSLLLLGLLLLIFSAAYALDNGGAVWQFVKGFFVR